MKDVFAIQIPVVVPSKVRRKVELDRSHAVRLDDGGQDSTNSIAPPATCLVVARRIKLIVAETISGGSYGRKAMRAATR